MAEAKPAEQPAEPARRVVRAPGPNNLKMRSEVSLDYWLFVPPGHGPDDLLNPDYWQHNARRLKTNTIVNVRAEDGSWFGMFLVVSAGDTWAKVVPILVAKTETLVEADGDPTPMDKRFKIDHIGTGWRVIHRDTGKVIKDQLVTRTDAEKIVQVEAGKRR